MKNSDCFRIGIINKLHGFKGELLMKFTFSDFKALPQLQTLLIEKNQKLIPFFIRAISIRTDGKAVIGLDGVENEKQAIELLNAAVFLQNKYLPAKKTSETDIISLIGYTVNDAVAGNIGVLDCVLEYPGNRVLQIENESGKEILVPAIDNKIIKKTDHDQRIIFIDAPNGLIDLYLSDTQTSEEDDSDALFD